MRKKNIKKRIIDNLKQDVCILVVLLFIIGISLGITGVWYMMVCGASTFMLLYCLGVLIFILSFLIYCLQDKQGNVIDRFYRYVTDIVEANEAIISKIKGFFRRYFNG